MKAARILLVDDEVEIIRLLTRRLTRRGYEVAAATDAGQALALLEQRACDLAIIDFMMPGISGLELAAQCRLRFPALKILMLTGSPVVTEIEAAGYAYLPKPLENLQELDSVVERMLVEAGKGPGAGAG